MEGTLLSLCDTEQNYSHGEPSTQQKLMPAHMFTPRALLDSLPVLLILIPTDKQTTRTILSDTSRRPFQEHFLLKYWFNHLRIKNKSNTSSHMAVCMRKSLHSHVHWTWYLQTSYRSPTQKTRFTEHSLTTLPRPHHCLYHNYCDWLKPWVSPHSVCCIWHSEPQNPLHHSLSLVSQDALPVRIFWRSRHGRCAPRVSAGSPSLHNTHLSSTSMLSLI